jgi:hypothetical protein
MRFQAAHLDADAIKANPEARRAGNTVIGAYGGGYDRDSIQSSGNDEASNNGSVARLKLSVKPNVSSPRPALPACLPSIDRFGS